MSEPLLLHGVELDGIAGRWVLSRSGTIAAIGDSDGARLPPMPRGTRAVEAGGGALLRGLKDHHCHLFASAAADGSIRCGPPDVTDARTLGSALRAAAVTLAPGDWLRGVGYDEDVVGVRSASELDALMGDGADRPVRLSHRSGHAWLLNTRARVLLGLPPAGGLLLNADDVVRERLGAEFPSLGPFSRRLAGYGVTGVTDAGQHNAAAEFAALGAATDRGELLQRTLVLGGEQLPAGGRGLVRAGALKIVLAEDDLPALDDLVRRVNRAGVRGVAIHAVSLPSLVLAAAALAAAGRAGQRIEHASVASPDVVGLLTGVRARVVTQPGFVARHGDRYLRTVEAADQPWLYRLRGWLAAGVPLAGGSDAPYGPEDPWQSMRAAVDRRSATGQVLGAGEALSPEQALDLFLTPLGAPGAPVRPLAVGDPADLCLLSVPWRQARQELSADLVQATVVAGRLVHHRSPGGAAPVA